MKRFCLYVASTVLFLFCTIGMQAQTTQPASSQSSEINPQATQTKPAQTKGTQSQSTLPKTKINQVELMKIWVGTWKAEMGNEITCTIECKSVYNGFEFHSVIETKGKGIVELTDITGYDKKSDKMIKAEITNNSPEMTLYSFWFTSPAKCQKIIFGDDENPNNANVTFVYEFKSPELFISTEIRKGKTINSYSFLKIK